MGKKYGPSIRDQIRAGTLLLEDALVKAPRASADTKRKWARAAKGGNQ